MAPPPARAHHEMVGESETGVSIRFKWKEFSKIAAGIIALAAAGGTGKVVLDKHDSEIEALKSSQARMEQSVQQLGQGQQYINGKLDILLQVNGIDPRTGRQR